MFFRSIQTAAPGAVLLWAAAIGAAAAVAADTNDPAATAIRNLLTEQAAAWNRGDIDSFMQYYWKSDDLTFSSGGETRRGWQAAQQRYKTRYPTREHMGRLTFDRLEIQLLCDSAALVLGRWQLERKRDPVGGNFTLVFRRLHGRWLIVHDHTSTGPPADAKH